MIDNSNILQLITICLRLSNIVGLMSLIIAKYYLPDFLRYGKTFTFAKNGNENIWDKIKNFSVPKSYFAHFYILSSALALVTLASYPTDILVWQLFLHSSRRLYETLYISKYTEKSKMNWSHYAVGLWFYSQLNILVYLRVQRENTTARVLPILVMVLASWDQYKNHVVLSKLKKYSLPRSRLFELVCCPHYLDEMIIYGSLVSYGHEFVWPLIWVIASLSISALESRKFYLSKFKDTEVPRYAAIPYIL